MTATAKKLELSPAVLKAIAWLDQVTEEDGSVRRRIDMETGEFDTISTEITGYAAHLFAWLALVTGEGEFRKRAQRHADWICNLWRANNNCFLPFEPGSDLTYFFDCGIAARGLRMVELAVRNRVHGNIADEITSGMRRFNGDGCCVPICNRDWQRELPDPGWWSSEPGTHQLKALLAFGKVQWNSYDFGEPFEETGDLLHPLAYTAEALLMNGDPQGAVRLMLRLRPWSDPLFRCDVLAQITRICQLSVEKTLPKLEALLDFQDADSGGFWFAKRDGKMVPHLSTHATIFAIQAMVMSEMEEIPDFGELSIV